MRRPTFFGFTRSKTESEQSGPELPQKPGGKDAWDKISTLSTIVSTIVIAIVGGFYTHRFQVQQAADQKKIQETQAVAQLMQYLTCTEQQQKQAFVAIKVLGDTKLMVDLASSDPRAPGARGALRDVEFYGATQDERNLAVKVLSQFEFAPSCTLPFQSVAKDHPIDYSDTSCGMYGSSSSAELRLQNYVKNNFCAGTDYRDVSIAEFATLQRQADTRVEQGGVVNLPSDRRVLRNLDNGIGEGSAVRLTGYIMGAHYSDTTGGESVNCNFSGTEPNDIHVNLVTKADETDPCQSITAEISPHMRPARWEADQLQSLVGDKVLVRFSGQLMMDASHRPCTGDVKPNPKRLSTWEIHPVYLIEKCATVEQGVCTKWEPLATPPIQ